MKRSVMVGLVVLAVAVLVGVSVLVDDRPHTDANPNVDVGPVPGSYAAKVPTAYQHKFSPFSASVGICHETDNETLAQLSAIAKNFKMMHIYRYDEQALQIAQKNNMEILLGTDIKVGISFATQEIADTYVRTRILPYKNVIKAICIGNEPNIDKTFIDSKTFARIASHVSKALKKNKLDIPVTVNLVFGCTASLYPPSRVTFKPAGSVNNGIYSPIPYIQTIASVNPGKPFLFYDFYPNLALGGKVTLQYCLFESGRHPGGVVSCGMFDAQYLSACNATYAVNDKMEVYVAETGWPNAPESGPGGSPENQASYVNYFYNRWVKPQGGPGASNTIPVFLFYAYPNRNSNAVFALFNNSKIDFSQYSEYNGVSISRAGSEGK